MKKAELILGILAILVIVLKLLQIDGSSILIVLILSILSLFYYVFSFALFNNIRFREILKKDSYKNTNAKKIIFAICLGFSISQILSGGLFKLQFWPKANILLILGLVIMILILIITSFFYFRSKTDFYKSIIKRIAIYGGLGLLLYLTPTNTLIKIYYKENSDHVKLYQKLLSEPDNQELKEQYEIMSKDIDEQKLLKEEEEK